MRTYYRAVQPRRQSGSVTDSAQPTTAIAVPEWRRLLREGLWVAAGHGAAALGTLAGVRLLTEIATPPLYGAFALINGGLVLLQGLIFQPLAQATLRFYPEYEAVSAVHVLHRSLVRDSFCRWRWIAVACFAAAVVDAAILGRIGPLVWALVAATAGLDAWKMSQVVMRNAARHQKSYAALLAADAFARPAGSVTAAWALGSSLESLLLGQAAGAFAVLAATLRPARHAGPTPGQDILAKNDLEGLHAGMQRFAAPLFWMPLAGWISALADRYVVGGILGMAQAGVYAAAYGLASRPLLMLGALSESTLRQPLYAAAVRGNTASLRTLLSTWLAVNLIAGAALASMLGGASRLMARCLLAADYRIAAAPLIPLISSGYVLFLATQVLERLLYSAQRTRAVLLVEAVGAGFAVAAAAIGSLWFGLKGVAAAVPIYFAIQLFLAVLLAMHPDSNLIKQPAWK